MIKLEWKNIAAAPEASRVFVAGYQPQSDGVGGYWWWHEDVVFEGRASEHTGASHYCEITLPGKFPDRANHIGEAS